MTSAIVTLLIAMLSIQLGAGLAKSLFPIAGAGGTTGLRLLFATLILWAVWRPWRFRADREILKKLAVYGASLGLMNLTFYLALVRIPLGLAVTLEFVGPLGLSILSSRKKIDWVWAALAATGIALVMPRSGDETAVDLLGVFYALVAGVFWALYIHFGQRAGSAVHGGIATTLGMTVATLTALPFAVALDGPKLLNPAVLPLGLLVAALSSAIPYSLEMYALKRMPAKTFSIFMSIEPAIASLVGIVLLREDLLLTQYLAILLVIAASFGSVFTASRENAVLPEQV